MAARVIIVWSRSLGNDRMEHEPVLLQEVIEGLNLSPGAVAIDATLGLGGHTKAILGQTAPNGIVIGFDRDERNLEEARKRLSESGDRVRFIHDSFGNMAEHQLDQVDAILFDLGISSVHVDEADRGFSFMKEGPLDMRFDQAQQVSAEVVVNSWPREELERLFRVYGEEPRAREIVKAILDARKKNRITSTIQLAEIVEGVVKRRGKSHPATRVFQAIRIAVNDELGEVERGLPAAADLLKPGGRIAVISFHSIEDRLVKQFLKSREDLTIITKKPITSAYGEIRRNPRARSAKLRVAQKN